MDIDLNHHRGGKASEALRESGGSPDPRVKAFLDALAATAAKQLLLQLGASEPQTKEEQA